MSEYVAIRDGGKTSEIGANHWLGQLFRAGYITGWAVSQRGAGANMSVDVAEGAGSIMRSTDDYPYYGFSDATKNVVVTAADGTNPRRDIVVAYVDKSVVQSATSDNPNALVFAIVAGTPAGSPSDPSDGDIQTAVGASNPFIKLARIAVAAGASSIVNANITDLRTPAALVMNRLYGGGSNTIGHLVPNVADDTVALLAAAQAFSNKTFGDTLGGEALAASAMGSLGMINGKLSVTVASNNITVAVKTLAGTDPSSSDPVKIVIGGTLRKITAALSVTKNAGTNWFNAGASETATKEIDYFAYLGYNATDGVVIGFARIPYVNKYSEFNTTTTNANYAAISTITNAASNDEYKVVGRFAATLSATASFNWSVPTYTPLNLIQYPIFITRWLDYVPTHTASGSMTFTTTTDNYAKYRIFYNTMELISDVTGTTGGSASNELNQTIPFPSLNTNQVGYGHIQDSLNIGAWAGLASTTQIFVRPSDSSNYGLGAGRGYRIRFPFNI